MRAVKSRETSPVLETSDQTYPGRPSAVKPRLLIATANNSRSVLHPQFQFRSVQDQIEVCRLLANRLAQRCGCDVRIDGDVEYNSLQAANNESDCINDDITRHVPSALVVIHTTPSDARKCVDVWHSCPRWQTSEVGSAAAVWIGLERLWKEDENDKSLMAVYNVYFVSPQTSAEPSGIR
jgi:hypothetical protein